MERDGKHLAAQKFRRTRLGESGRHHHSFSISVKLKSPGVAIDEKQFSSRDLRVELYLLPRTVIAAHDFDGEVGAPDPV